LNALTITSPLLRRRLWINWHMTITIGVPIGVLTIPSRGRHLVKLGIRLNQVGSVCLGVLAIPSQRIRASMMVTRYSPVLDFSFSSLIWCPAGGGL